MFMPHSRSGFTLLELAIVLVIIALTIGAVVAGQALVRNSELREVLGEYDRNIKAISEFQQKYSQLPGDYNNATSLWGAADDCPVGNATDLLQKATCDGNADYRVGVSDGQGFMENKDNGEWYRAWQHLSNAGFIEGLFNGAQGTQGADHGIVGVNIPASKLTSAGWTLGYLLASTNASDAELWPDSYGHILILGSTRDSNHPANGAVLSPGEAFSLDNKIDDGKPSRGTMRVRISISSDTCVDRDLVPSQDTDQYKQTSSDDPVCRPFFLTGF
jgi:prepilin-type N-terminal cleavage/methylation domain-containing protein